MLIERAFVLSNYKEKSFRFQSPAQHFFARFLPSFAILFIFLVHLLFFSASHPTIINTQKHRKTHDSIRPAYVDVNECSEGTDDCNRKTQLCLNTRGGYKCQEKIGDKCFPGLKYNSGTKLCEGARRLFNLFAAL